MIDLFEKLMKDSGSLGKEFRQGVEFWKEFFANYGLLDDKTLTEKIGRAQIPFEHKLGWDRSYAKSLMPAMMFLALYDFTNGFGDNENLARRLPDCIENSMVSVEVKGTAVKVAQVIFGLDD
jgi:hypothetical protein